MFISSSRSSIGWAELWRCLGYKFESYLGQSMDMLKLVYRLRLGRGGENLTSSSLVIHT